MSFHFVRFGEALRVVQDNLNSKNFYAFNPEFDRGMKLTSSKVVDDKRIINNKSDK